MSIIEILILLAFVFFPLIQALLEKMGGGKGRDLPPEQEETREHAPVGTMEPPQSRIPRAEEPAREEGWSAGWGQWQAETLEELSAEEVVSEEEADELIAHQKRVEERTAVSEAARVTVPVVSMEQLQIDRGAEHRRFHERLARTATPPPKPVPVSALVGVLRNPTDLRQAIVLAEVLGPPRSMQPTERPIGD